jgi:HEAT repeat protein
MDFSEIQEVKPHIEALRLDGRPEAVKALIGALEHRDDGVAAVVAYALGELKDARAAPALVETMDRGGLLATHCAIALGKIGEKAVPVIAKALEHKKSELIYHSSFALADIGGNKALVTLMKYADHPNKDVKKVVKDAIRRIQEAKHA